MTCAAGVHAPCTRTCHDHYGCAEPVPKELKCGHKASLPCCRDPADVECTMRIRSKRELCGHEVEHQCGTGANTVICREPVVINRPRECYHSIRVESAHTYGF